MNANLLTDAVAPLTELLKGVEALGLSTSNVTVKYRRDQVAISLTGKAAEAPEDVWELVRLEFKHAGWGFHTRFHPGGDFRISEIVCDHPITLTRVRRAN